MPPYFPNKEFKNKAIILPGEGNDGFRLSMVQNIGELMFMKNGNYLPLKFTLEANNKSKIQLFDNEKNELKTQDGLSDWILTKAQEKYSFNIIKEDLFHYVYGFLHSPIYRKKYANTLTKQAPSIPLVNEKSFWQYVNIGKELMDLHLDYENQPKLPEVEVSGEEQGHFQVNKMSYIEGSPTIQFNDYITISNIPAKAYDYLITDKSAIWWVMNQYQRERTSSKSHYPAGIPNDPNIYAQEIGNPRYILDLLLSVITLSVKTLEIIDQMPHDLD